MDVNKRRLHMEKFNKINYFKLRKMDIKDVEEYYLKLRKYEYDNNTKIRNIRLKKIIHFLPLKLVKLDRVLSHDKLKVISDLREESKRPKIYAATHIGGVDIQRTFEAIKEHAYLFLGDPKELYIDATGLILKMNGSISFETKDKEDRKIAYNRSIELLKRGGNLLIYPEGAWNISPNMPVTGLYPGVINMAKETKADIIPVAIEQFNNRFYVNIGKNIKYEDIKDKDTDSLRKELRDILATLKWKIWENEPFAKRFAIKESKEEFIEKIIDRCEYNFTKEDVYHDMYKEKNVVSPSDAYIVSPEEEFEKRKQLTR